jgi:hypothetical protein
MIGVLRRIQQIVGADRCGNLVQDKLFSDGALTIVGLSGRVHGIANM